MTADQNRIISNTKNFVKKTLENAEGGHDWFHIWRVYKNAQHIAKTESVNSFVVELAALLHDIADAKFHNGDENLGAQKTEKFLTQQDLDSEILMHVVKIVQNVSFKGGHNNSDFDSKELQVVQDADRLDAIGAIGIARAFNYGGFKNRKIYDPEVSPTTYETTEAYRRSDAPTINHFYEKLLLLKDQMHTTSARKIAEERHEFMKNFLAQFYAEWDGKR